MGKAEPGSNRALNKQMKQRGLTKLKWYCEPCKRAMRDENAYKQHTLSESHVRIMLVIAENFKGFQANYDKEFLTEFISLLKTSHGEKRIEANRFYQEFIAKKDHTHLNSTQWKGEFSAFIHWLGREGICRVDEENSKLMIAWIDNSPEALRRKQALQRREQQEQQEKDMEEKAVGEQVRRAKEAVKRTGEKEISKVDRVLKREGDEKISLALDFGGKKVEKKKDNSVVDISGEQFTDSLSAKPTEDKKGEAPAKPAGFGGMSLKLGGSAKPKNVFAQQKNALLGGKKKVMVEQPKQMCQAEKIMKEEMEKKRKRKENGRSAKKMKFSFGGK